MRTSPRWAASVCPCAVRSRSPGPSASATACKKRFSFPIRTTAEDSIEPPAPLAQDASLEDNRLSTEAAPAAGPAQAMQTSAAVSEPDKQRIFRTHSPRREDA